VEVSCKIVVDIFESQDDTKVIVARLISGGLTVKAVAEFLRTDYFSVYKIVNEIKSDPAPKAKRGRRWQKIQIVMVPKPGRRIPSEKMAEAKRLLLESNLGILEIAKRLGLRSRSSIYCLRDRLQREQENESVREEGSTGTTFKTLTKPKRWEVHGDVSVWPCVICEAEKHRKRQLSDQAKDPANQKHYAKY
jgi:AraC-like DNA-binding protein